MTLSHTGSHPVWGAWIEIVLEKGKGVHRSGRTPCGVRGLKLDLYILYLHIKMSHPVWGAWIEISIPCSDSIILGRSHPVWGAWIEIDRVADLLYVALVAPRVGCVD